MLKESNSDILAINYEIKICLIQLNIPQRTSLTFNDQARVFDVHY